MQSSIMNVDDHCQHPGQRSMVSVYSSVDASARVSRQSVAAALERCRIAAVDDEQQLEIVRVVRDGG